MDDENLIRQLAGEDASKVKWIRQLIRTDERVAEIHAEYQVAEKAYRHWRDRSGADSHTAVQYSELMREREQELRDLLNLE